jgi:hypothetical protein
VIARAVGAVGLGFIATPVVRTVWSLVSGENSVDPIGLQLMQWLLGYMMYFVAPWVFYVLDPLDFRNSYNMWPWFIPTAATMFILLTIRSGWSRRISN